MLKTFQFTKHVLNATGCALVLLSAAVMPLHAAAHDGHDHAIAVESTDQMTVVRDAETGKLRAPTADERSVMQEKAVKRRDVRIAAPRTLQKFHHSGAVGVRVTDEFMSTSVAVRKPDGSVAQQCFDSKEEADAALKSAGMTVTTAVTTTATE